MTKHHSNNPTPDSKRNDHHADPSDHDGTPIDDDDREDTNAQEEVEMSPSGATAAPGAIGASNSDGMQADSEPLEPEDQDSADLEVGLDETGADNSDVAQVDNDPLGEIDRTLGENAEQVPEKARPAAERLMTRVEKAVAWIEKKLRGIAI